MKIVVKHVDNLKSTFSKGRETIPQYLVYNMTDDNIPVDCHIANGDEEKKNKVRWIQLMASINNNLPVSTNDSSFTLPIHEISYSEFKNKAKLNSFTDVGSN